MEDYIGESMNVGKRICEHKSAKTQMIAKAIKKYGIDNFEVEVYYLPDFDKESLITLEEQMIIKYNSLAPSGYNVCVKGCDNTGRKYSDESKLKMSLSKIGKTHTEESKRSMSLSKKGKKKKPFSEEHKENIRKARIGAKASPKAIENMKKVQKIRANSEEGKRVQSEIMKKRYEDPEERLKLSNASKGEKSHKYGIPMSEEQKIKISNSLKGEKNPNYGKPSHNRGKKASEETKRKQSEGLKAAHERRRKLKESNLSSLE